jgi:hypothetical protein
VIGEIEEKKMNEEVKFIKQFHIFSFLTRITLHKMYYSLKIIKLKRG